MKNCLRKFKIFKNGFTLAEVLITLVIIGVIAAMTIPNIVYETKKHEYTARLKKFYSTMKQVEQNADAAGKSWMDWVIVNNFTDGGSINIQTFIQECILPYMSYHKVTSDTVYLNDGSFFTISQGSCLDFVFDVNGDKKPNVGGRDRYDFLYCPADLTFKSYRWTYQNSRTDLFNMCKNQAWTCSGLLMMDGWEFKSDYPYRL